MTEMENAGISTGSKDPVSSKKIVLGFVIVILILASPFLLFGAVGLVFCICLLLGFASDSPQTQSFFDTSGNMIAGILALAWIMVIGMLVFLRRKGRNRT